MRAVTIVDGDLHWSEHPEPSARPGELLVAVAAAGLNGADMLQRRGHYPAPPGWPQDIPGMEFAGDGRCPSATVPTASRRGPGDGHLRRRWPGRAGGGPGVDPADRARRVRPGGRAGGFPEVFSTAYDALFTQAELDEGERVLISGAAGGVGTAGVQLAAAAGAHVVATVRVADRHDAVRALGAHEVIRPDEIGAAAPTTSPSSWSGRRGSRPCSPPGHRGPRRGDRCRGRGQVEVNLLALMGRRARIGGSTLRSRTVEEKTGVARLVESRVVPLLGTGAVTVPVAATFPMAQATDAYDMFRAGGKLGKIVLVNEE